MIGLAFLGVVAGHLPHRDLRQVGRKEPSSRPSRLVVTGLGRSSSPVRTYEEPSFPTSLPRLPEDARTRSPVPVGSRHRGVDGQIAQLTARFKSWSFSSRTTRLVAALNEEAGRYVRLESTAMQVHRLVGVGTSHELV